MKGGENSQFKHLGEVNQNYTEHFKDSIKYSWIALKGSFYFLCHAIYPDSFEKSGSETIHFLDERLKQKYAEFQRENSQ